jgi:hypothetical protein
MSEPQPLDPANRELAEALESLRLAPTQANQRDIWYRAGMEAGRKRTNAWRMAAAIMTLAAGAMVMHARIVGPAVVDRVVYVYPAGAALVHAMYSNDAPLLPNFSAANLRLRNAVLQNGPDALPMSVGASEEGPSLRPGMSLPAKDG